MKCQIRNSLFETNSSSTHTLVFTRNQKADPSNFKDSLALECGYYGWGPKILFTPQEKLSYLLTILYESHNVYVQEYYLKLIKNHLIMANIKYYVPDNYEMTDEWRIFGLRDMDVYIDHQSVDNYIIHNFQLRDEIEDIIKNYNNFIDFLFGDLSFVSLNNDNDGSDLLYETLEEKHFKNPCCGYGVVIYDKEKDINENSNS